ncbi:ABC transporter permease protein [Desulfocucumis palustris]|uniref:ABC transporter permease protein n=1 Tax=Desulfocucumis palustris TaxID=1898651 RepID=A0A2L2XDL5_9FIRM|nr:ABC transporter permease protein [Desulfocucumis palustris]
MAVLGVAFGCALMTFLFSISSGMEKRMERTFNEVSGQIVISGRDSIFGGMLMGMGSSTIPGEYMDVVKGLPHIKEVFGQVSVILRPEAANVVMPLFGYDSLGDMGPAGAPFKNIIEGTVPSGPNEVIMGKSLKEYMELLDIPYEMGGIYRFTVTPGDNPYQFKELKVVGIYQSGNEILDGGFSADDKLARDIGNINDGRYSAIVAQVDDLEHVDAAVKDINHVTGGGKSLQVTVPRELLVPLKSLLNSLNNFLLAISLVAVVAGGLSISVVMLLSIIERRKEFGILKALGWKPGDVVFMVMVESVSLSVLGALLGVVMGYAGLSLAVKYMAVEIALLNWKVVSAVIFYGFLVGAVGGLYPAWRAKNTPPADIMRTL